MMTLRAPTFIVAALFLAACSDSEGDLRQAVLAHLHNEVMVANHRTLAELAEDLAAAPVCAADPAPAQTAWRAARAAWGHTAAFWFGPVVDDRQLSALDFWPVRADNIEAAVAAASPEIRAEDLASAGVSTRGLPALEYLLFAEPVTPGTRCAYTTAVATDIATRSAALAQAWADRPATTDQAALDEIVNAAIECLYRMVKDKLDRPLGNLSGAPADPSLVESRYSDHGTADLAANLVSFKQIYLGADEAPGGEPGLGALVALRDADLDTRIQTQLDRAQAAVAALPDNLGQALLDDRNTVQTARDDVDTLRRLIKLDVASQLGVTLSLSDNDGD